MAGAAPAAASCDAAVRAKHFEGAGLIGLLSWNSNVSWLAGPEGDDAPNRIVRRHADGDAIPGHDLDAEAAHSTAELGEHFVSGVALHAVKTTTVYRHDSALHVDEIVLAQTASNPFCKTNIVPYKSMVNQSRSAGQ